MKCKNCGAQLKENSRFCPKCGRPVEDFEAADGRQSGKDRTSGGRQSAAGKASGHGQTAAAAVPKESKRGGRGIAVVILLLVLALAGAGGFAYYKLVWLPGRQETAAPDAGGWGGADSDKREKKQETDADEPEKADEPSKETMAEDESSATEPETVPETAEFTEAATSETEPEKEHRYEIIMKDCTWTEAFADAKARGGYLVHIDTMEEYDFIRSNLLNTEASRKLKLWIGGARVAGSYDYHWANPDGTLGETVLNGDAYPGVWMAGEPSFRDDSINQDEYYMNLFYYNKENRWVWNDVPDDIISVVSSYKGSVGYICEFEQ